MPCQMHCYDTDAGRLAMAAIFPQIASKRCIRHQLQAVRRRNGDLKKFVASMVSFTSHTVNPFLLDLLWQYVLQRLASVDVDWEACLRTCQRRGPKTGPPDKISSKTSSPVSVVGFPGQFLLQLRGGSC